MAWFLGKPGGGGLERENTSIEGGPQTHQCDERKVHSDRHREMRGKLTTLH